MLPERLPEWYDELSRRCSSDQVPAGPPANLLERLLARPAPSWRVEDLVGLVGDRGIELVSLMHVGGDGWMKTLDFIPRSAAHLADILEAGERADGSSLFPHLGVSAGASDVVLRPRLHTAFLEPFSPRPTLAVLCGHHGRDGAPLPQSPDTVVRRAFERAQREAGVELWALGEVEFFLGKHANDTDIYGARDRGYHATSPFVFGEALRRQALALLAQMGLAVKYAHSEVGYIEARETHDMIWEQHEIELGLAPLPQAAEAVCLTQWVLRSLAHRMGLRTSFEPIVLEGHAGSGLHIHLSPVMQGRHLGGRRPDGSLEEPARWLIAGLTRLAGALMAFGNRRRESFIRLRQAREAPNTVFWGDSDRKALIRLPMLATAPDGRPVGSPTVEFRLPDGSAHPHLLLAGIAQALIHGRAQTDLDGLLERTGAARAGDGAQALLRVPRSFAEVAKALAEEREALEAGAVFPAGMIEELARTLGA